MFNHEIIIIMHEIVKCSDAGCLFIVSVFHSWNSHHQMFVVAFINGQTNYVCARVRVAFEQRRRRTMREWEKCEKWRKRWIVHLHVLTEHWKRHPHTQYTASLLFHCSRLDCVTWVCVCWCQTSMQMYLSKSPALKCVWRASVYLCATTEADVQQVVKTECSRHFDSISRQTNISLFRISTTRR